MRPYAAYQRTQNEPTTRIDLVLTLYRQGLDFLQRARTALTDGRKEDALPHLAKTQMIVMALAAGIPLDGTEVERNLLRLYEFVSYQTTQATLDGVEGATKVLRSLARGFERARQQALDLEYQGTIPPLGSECLVSMTA